MRSPDEVPALERTNEVGEVVRGLLGIEQLGRFARRRREIVDLTLDARFDLVGQLDAAAGEQLDAVVAIGVMRGRDDRPDGVAAGGLERHGGCRHDTETVDDDPLRSHPGDERRLEHCRRHACVAADNGFDALVRSGRQYPRRGTAEVEGERGGQVDVGDAADTVRPEFHDAGTRSQRSLVNCFALRALTRPYFLLSFLRGSR